MPLFSVAKRALPYLDAYALGSVRYALGVAVLTLLLVGIEGRAALRYDGRFVAATLCGLIGIAGFNLFVWIGLGLTRPEHASLILALQTPMTVLAVWALRRERPANFTLGCVMLALAGVLLVVTRGEPLAALADLAQGRSLLGDALVFCGAVAWLFYTLAVARFPGWSPLRYTTLTCIPGFVGLLAANAIAIGVGAATLPGWTEVSAVAWQIAYFSVGTVVLGVLAFNAATRRLGPLNVMLILNFVPVGVFAIEAALGRSFGAAELAGAGMVVAALVANNLFLRQRRNSAISN
jgi:drug/metabolite transporter (DMT)-like permease